jgi:iron complex outermembrane recepter protein
LRTNLALYYSDYDDIQVGQFVSDASGNVTIIKQNAGRARIQGGEFEITALLADLRLTGSLGISDGKYTSIEPGVVTVTKDTGLALPKTTVSIAADLPITLSFGRIAVHGDYSWRSDDADAATVQRLGHTAYGLFNATFSAAPHDSKLEFALWGRNLANTHYKASWVDSIDFIDEVPGDPRTFGVSASYRFGTRPP